MICPDCVTATDPDDREKTFEVTMVWRKMEGAMEGWTCPNCGRRSVTRMTNGVRKDAGILIPREEEGDEEEQAG